MQYHPVTKTIVDLLKTNNCRFETFEHAPVRTSEEAARLRPEYTMHQGAKALIVRITTAQKEKKFVMLVFPADMKFDAKKIKNLLAAKEVSFANEENVGEITGGVLVGGVPPFGNLFGLEVYADESLFGNEKIVFNAGDRSFSVAMRSEDYKKLVNPTICRFIVL
jgi:Ala-tRNA(Pro) deacylase